MSTFLVTFTVVVIALAGAVAVAVKDPEQPATLRARRRREATRRPPAPKPAKPARTRPPVREPTPPGRPVAVPASVEISGFSDHWVPVSTGPTGWVRLRSGVVLTFLLAVLGALIAVCVAGFIVFVALAVRSAVS